MSDEIQTNDELTDKIDAALATEPDEQVEAQTEPTDQTPAEPAESEDSQETSEPATEQTPQDETAQPDYKQKFVDSQREAILLAERNKIKEARLEQLTKTDTPTDEAMRLVYPEWDDLNEVTRKALVKQEALEMRQRNWEAKQQEILDRQMLQEQIEEVIENNPKLTGKEAQFKRFAANPKNKGISAEVLAKAFLFDIEDEAPAPVQKTEALPTGSGGPRGDISPKKVSLEDAAKIRKSDYKRYMELVKNDQIEEV
jgi:hypothetical protein